MRFLEDGIKRVVKSEGELIGVGQLSPGDQVTVKHDEYAVYDVTATLMTFPTAGADGDVRYELNITATDSEPAGKAGVQQAGQEGGGSSLGSGASGSGGGAAGEQGGAAVPLT